MKVKILLFVLAVFIAHSLSTNPCATDGTGDVFTAVNAPTKYKCWGLGGTWDGSACVQGSSKVGDTTKTADDGTCETNGFKEGEVAWACSAPDASNETPCLAADANTCAAHSTKKYLIATNAIKSDVSKAFTIAVCVTADECKEAGGVISSLTCIPPTNQASCTPNQLIFAAADGAATPPTTNQCKAPTALTECYQIGWQAVSATECSTTAVTKEYCMFAGYTYGSGVCTSTVVTAALCAAEGYAFNTGTTKCITATQAACLTGGASWDGTKCSTTTLTIEDCYKGGYPTLTTVCTTTGTLTSQMCYEKFLVYNTDGKCYAVAGAPSAGTYKPTKQDCALYGYDLTSTGICAKFANKEACPVAVSTSDVANNFFTFSSSTGKCLPVAAQQTQVCNSYGLTAGSPCTVKTVCPHGWEAVTSSYNVDYCKPKSAEGNLPCLNLQLALDGDECVIPENDKCALLHSKLKANSAKTKCEFASSSYAADEKLAVCLSLGQTYSTGTTCTFSSCLTAGNTAFVKATSGYTSLCFPHDEYDCLNHVMSYTNTSTLCVDVIDNESGCSSAGLYVQMNTLAEVVWCERGENKFTRCYKPTGQSSCPSARPYYDSTYTEDYKCLTACSTTGIWTVDKTCYSSCPGGYHDAGKTSGGCTKCSPGCNTCTYHSTYGEDCSACDSKYVLHDDTNSIGKCYACQVSNCLVCKYDTYSTKCTTCPTTGYVTEITDTKDYCHECFKNCDSCKYENDAYQTYCSSCSSSSHPEKDDTDDENIIKCTCDTKYQNSQWRDQIFARNDYENKDPYIEEIDSESALGTFYCQLFSYFSKSIPSSCDSTVDLLLNSSEDTTILLKLVTRLYSLFSVSGSNFDETPNKAGDYLEHFLKLDLAAGNVSDEIISMALQVMNHDLFDESISTIVSLLNDYLGNVAADSQYVKFQGYIDSLVTKMNKKLLSSSSISTSLSSESFVKFYQNEISVIPSTNLLGIQFTAEMLEKFTAINVDTERIVIAKMQTNKRTFDPTETTTTDTKVKSGTQIAYSFAKKLIAGTEEAPTVSYDAIEFAPNEGCIEVNFEMEEVLTLSDSNANTIYVGQWQTDSSTWQISSVTQANIQENVQNLKACVSSFKTPFIAMEYTKQVSSTEYSSILSLSLLFLLLSLLF